ncbi:winged helix-turn-helix domain-containing protein [Svornostia abyssi]|uniref:Winged helix-turn-helix domain-containing protein n=1 Tax=Svornostia abyssi TaxID=2898438 RepID=A0ABY5PIR1_9ACTN|nr:winged helix-turn-helix domain-containing protein [Parviterribacteraceae bacterium J379]
MTAPVARGALAALADQASRAIVIALGDARGTALSAAEIVAASHIAVTLKLRLIRDRLRELERAGVVAAADVDPATHGPGLHWVLTASGQDLHRLLSVMQHVVADAAGLDDASPAPVRDRAVGRTLKALGDPVVMRIVTALAGGAELDPTALEERCLPTPRRTLYRRLDVLVTNGVVRRDTTRGVPRRTHYTIAPSWRQAAVLPLLAAWWEGRHGSAAQPVDVEAPLRIVLPNVRVARLPGGARVLWVVDQGTATQRLCLEADGAQLRMSTAAETTDAGATTTGTPQAWTAALVADQLEELRVTGDARLAQAVLEAVRAALFASVR